MRHVIVKGEGNDRAAAIARAMQQSKVSFTHVKALVKPYDRDGATAEDELGIEIAYENIDQWADIAVFLDGLGLLNTARFYSTMPNMTQDETDETLRAVANHLREQRAST